MEVFTANRLSNGNFLFPTEIRIDDHNVTFVKPGLITAREKSIKYSKITSVDVISPLLGFSKVVVSAYGLDQVVAEGFERRDAEEIKNIILKNMKGS